MSRPVVKLDLLLNKSARSTHFQLNRNLLIVVAKRWRRIDSAGKKQINKKEQCFPRVSQALLAIEYGKYKMFGSLITIFLWRNKFHLTRGWNSTKDLILTGGQSILAIIAKAPKRVQAMTGFEPVPQEKLSKVTSLNQKGYKIRTNVWCFATANSHVRATTTS